MTSGNAIKTNTSTSGKRDFKIKRHWGKDIQITKHWTTLQKLIKYNNEVASKFYLN